MNSDLAILPNPCLARLSQCLSKVLNVEPIKETGRLMPHLQLDKDYRLTAAQKLELRDLIKEEFGGEAVEHLDQADLLQSDPSLSQLCQLLGDQPLEPMTLPLDFQLNHDTHPFVADYAPRGRTLLPLAAAVEFLVQAQGKITPLSLERIESRSALLVSDETRVRLSQSGDELRLSELRGQREVLAFSARLGRNGLPLPILPAPQEMAPGSLDLVSFYAEVAFHGPLLQALERIKGVGTKQLSGLLKTSRPQQWVPTDSRPHWSVDPLLIDGAFQLIFYWAHTTQGKLALPVGIDKLLWLRQPIPGPVDVDIYFDNPGDSEFLGNIHFHQQGQSLGWLLGARARLQAAETRSTRDSLAIENLPGFAELRSRRQAFQDQGISIPYFQTHDQVRGSHSQIDGKEMINFSSYNYLGLSGHPFVNAASIAAVERYGTSVSASRLVAGERDLHRTLEQSVAQFLGTEDALVMVSGYLTNVTLISHLMESGDLILYDSLAHDSILRGARGSTAARQTFPHNDLNLLEERLKSTRNAYRRVLVVVEGAYSMDGDYPDLPRLVELRERFHFWLMVDEAHSFGTLGKTGRGVAEHYGVPRDQVDLWMGTLSKALASCGGYVAGRRQLIDYLKYTVPGFVFSVGIPPSSAAAAQAALELLEREPQRVLDLQARSQYFLEQVRLNGLDPGLSQGTPVVPVIVGDSGRAFDLTRMLGERGINTCPIVYPAVKEKAARLRYFMTNQHTPEELRLAARVTAECMAELNNRRAHC